MKNLSPLSLTVWAGYTISGKGGGVSSSKVSQSVDNEDTNRNSQSFRASRASRTAEAEIENLEAEVGVRGLLGGQNPRRLRRRILNETIKVINRGGKPKQFLENLKTFLEILKTSGEFNNRCLRVLE